MHVNIARVYIRRTKSTSGFYLWRDYTWYRRRAKIPPDSRSWRAKEFWMLSKSISPLSLPLSLRFSPPSAYAATIVTPYRPTISQDACPAWTRRAQPVADPDRRASPRPEIQPRSILKAFPLLSAIPTAWPFASSACCREKPRLADVRDVRIIRRRRRRCASDAGASSS